MPACTDLYLVLVMNIVMKKGEGTCQLVGQVRQLHFPDEESRAWVPGIVATALCWAGCAAGSWGALGAALATVLVRRGASWVQSPTHLGKCWPLCLGLPVRKGG